MKKISREFQLPLIGGDLAKGPLQISVTVLGKPEKKTLFRSNAQSGDILCLSGALGSGYIGLKEYKRSGEINSKTKPYLFPSAQITYGRNSLRTTLVNQKHEFCEFCEYILIIRPYIK